MSGEQEYTPTAARVLERAWDDGNASGLDGWVGPGRGAGEIDAEAERSRAREVARGEAELERLFAQRDERVRADERAKRPDREQLTQFATDAMRDAMNKFGPYSGSRQGAHIADALMEAGYVVEPEAREEPRTEVDIDTRMLLLDVGVAPRYVGPFPNNHAALSWAREHAPDVTYVSAVMWPQHPEAAREVSRGS